MIHCFWICLPYNGLFGFNASVVQQQTALGMFCKEMKTHYSFYMKTPYQVITSWFHICSFRFCCVEITRNTIRPRSTQSPSINFNNISTFNRMKKKQNIVHEWSSRPHCDAACRCMNEIQWVQLRLVLIRVFPCRVMVGLSELWQQHRISHIMVSQPKYRWCGRFFHI